MQGYGYGDDNPKMEALKEAIGGDGPVLTKTQVDGQLDVLERHLDELHKHISELQERLHIALREPEPLAEGKEAPKDVDSLVPLAMRINQARKTVGQAMSRIMDLLNRLEV